jgi:flavin-dependent dehydrogenase
MKNTEFAVIGGGLAGLSLSILLARNGKSVRLIERNAYPFHRVCGEYISRESLPFLTKLLPELDWKSLPVIDQLVVSSVSGKTLKNKLDLGGIGISRFYLDQELAIAAKKAGVLIEENCLVKNWLNADSGFSLETASGDFECEKLILAYGKGRGPASKAKKLNRNFIGVKYHIRFPHPADEIQLHNFRNGYCGMSRVENGISCLCYLVDAAELKSSNNNIKEMEYHILRKNPFLKEIFDTAEFLWDEPKTVSGITFGEKGSMQKNAFVIGDAAGSIAPLCGNGMSMALHGAYKLANVLTENTLHADLALQHTKGWKSEFSNRILTGRLIQEVFGKEWMSNLAIEVLNQSPVLSKKLISLTHGKVF